GQADVKELWKKLPESALGLVGWRNYYRDTDPIGGRILPPKLEAELPDPETKLDIELADPSRVPPPPSPPDEPPLERSREPWIEVAGHSDYLSESELKAWVEQLKVAFRRRPR